MTTHAEIYEMIERRELHDITTFAVDPYATLKKIIDVVAYVLTNNVANVSRTTFVTNAFLDIRSIIEHDVLLNYIEHDTAEPAPLDDSEEDERWRAEQINLRML